ELPEAERWRQEREERERRLAARLAELDSGDWQQADEAQTATFAPRPENEADFETYGSVPFRRQDVKVGRNEPCPCGSGKKFKRCCGRE
ncbi:MAG: SEC-C domain-containing protein, partial [Deltaproteobacteria bacterium]|nr:SEC-C domain-containing protein [Deltaproteobacteria bacterium]